MSLQSMKCAISFGNEDNEVKMDMTLKIALYAAILSTITALVQIFNYRRDRANIRVKIGIAKRVEMYEKTLMNKGTIIKIFVANRGRRPVTIRACYVKAGGLGMPSYEYINRHPEMELGEGKAYTYTVENESIDKFGLTSEDLCAYALDATHKYYWSDPIFVRWIKAVRGNRKIFKKRGAV